MVHRWQFVSLAVIFAAAVGSLLMSVSDVRAQPPVPYPTHPVRIINPFPPGGGVDLLARTLAQLLEPALGQPVVVENRPGASTMIAAEAVARSAADGHTLFITVNTYIIAPLLISRPRYDSVKDFTPIVTLTLSPSLVVVHESLPVRSIADLIALAKATPGGLSYASLGNGSVQHIQAELFRRAAGIPLVQVPYKGIALAINDVITGRVPLMFSGLAPFLPHMKSQKLRMIGVQEKKRVPLFPDVPTLAESGYPNTEVPVWFALLGPAGLPASIVEKLNREINTILRQPEIRERFSTFGFEIVGGTSQELGTLVESDYARYRQLLPELGIKAD